MVAKVVTGKLEVEGAAELVGEHCCWPMGPLVLEEGGLEPLGAVAGVEVGEESGGCCGGSIWCVELGGCLGRSY